MSNPPASPLSPGRALSWVAGIALLLLAAQQLLGQAADRLLIRDAEHTAIGYARHLGTAVTDLDIALSSGRIESDTLDDLRQHRRMGDVFRYKLFDPHGQQLLASDDLDRADPVAASRGQHLGIDHGQTDAALRTKVLRGRTHVEMKDGRGVPNRPAFYTEAYVPLVQGRTVLGVIEVYVDQTERAQRIHTAFIEVAGLVAGLMAALGGVIALQARQRHRERREAEARMRYLAEHDVLSGALNRASFNEALQRAVWRHEKGGPGFAVLCIDLDRFKDVNDGLGHGAGDQVLREATERLMGLVRHGDVVARLGGDEFAVLQSSVFGSDDVARLAQRIVDGLAQPYQVNGQNVTCGGSVGAARFGTDAITVAELLHKADVAMYRAKANGRGCFAFYDPALDRQLEDRRTLANDLRGALDAGALSLHYQPLYAADGVTLLGYEALMRWHHPVRGPVPPSEFIPLAEDTGQIEALGAWALRQACADAVCWPGTLAVSVNLSPAQFRAAKDLVALVARTLSGAGLAPERLTLEITESLLMNDTDAVVRTLESLSAMGVRIAMDDFGTGYSSLAYLWRFPFDKVKIDRAFTQGLGTDAKVALIVRSIVSLAHSMGIRVNAEGVESAAQCEQLRRLGCDELQGFLLGRPAPVETLDHHGAAAAAPGRPPAPRLGDLLTQPSPL